LPCDAVADAVVVVFNLGDEDGESELIFFALVSTDDIVNVCDTNI
jgi:hypothetical protein